MDRRRRGRAGVPAALAARWVLGAPARTEQRLCHTHAPPPYAASTRARKLHARLRIADLHADSLLWGRDLVVRSERGHVDVPRLIEGNLALQALAASVKVPRHLNLDANGDGSDDVLFLALAGRWPRRTWRSLMERAFYLAERAAAFAEQSGGRLRIIETREDLVEYLADRAVDPGTDGRPPDHRGAHALEDDLANVDLLADAGYRMMSPSHFFDTAFGGSAHGLRKGGLTELGREMIVRMEERGMLVDVAHASTATIADATAIARRPVVASHTGVCGTHDTIRNLSDDQLRGIAATGGLVGIGFWDTVTGGSDAAAIARAIRYTVDLVGAEHVALGSDWDGAVPVPFDATGLVLLTEALLDDGLDEGTIRAVMGENVFRVLAATLPARAG